MKSNSNKTARKRAFLFHELLARVLVAIHVAILFWVFIGTVLMFFDKNYIPTHMIFISMIIVAGLFLGYCPLTKLEERLRRKKQSDFTLHNSFMAFYVNKLIGTDFTPTQINFFQSCVFVFSYLAGALLYFLK